LRIAAGDDYASGYMRELCSRQLILGVLARFVTVAFNLLAYFLPRYHGDLLLVDAVTRLVAEVSQDRRGCSSLVLHEDIHIALLLALGSSRHRDDGVEGRVINLIHIYCLLLDYSGHLLRRRVVI